MWGAVGVVCCALGAVMLTSFDYEPISKITLLLWISMPIWIGLVPFVALVLMRDWTRVGGPSNPRQQPAALAADRRSVRLTVPEAVISAVRACCRQPFCWFAFVLLAAATASRPALPERSSDFAAESALFVTSAAALILFLLGGLIAFGQGCEATLASHEESVVDRRSDWTRGVRLVGRLVLYALAAWVLGCVVVLWIRMAGA